MQKDIDAVNDILFQVLNDVKEDKMEHAKAKAIVGIAGAIAKNASLQLQAFTLTKGKTAAPKTLIKGKAFATIGSGDIHAQKTEFAISLGYKDIVEAIGDLSANIFNKRFKQEFE